jgi:hypothetical protein
MAGGIKNISNFMKPIDDKGSFNEINKFEKV